MADAENDTLNALLDAIADAVVRRDACGRVTYVNAGFRRAFGGAAADWVGRWFAAAPVGLGEHDAARLRRRYDSALDTVTGPAWYEWEETSLPDGGTVAVGRDVSARRAGEAALKGARDAAEDAARAKETVFANVTHELRTPLNGVIGMADLLDKTPLTPEQRAYVAAVRDSGRHLLALVDDILDAAKLEAGAATLDAVDVDLAALIEAAVELVGPRAREKGLEVASVVSAAAPRLVTADPGRLRQILLNLIGNAVKFTETGGVMVSLVVSPAPAGAVDVRIAVRDTGPGVPESERARIFNAFAQVDASHAKAAEGAGLGLAIARRLADVMGGDIDLVAPEDGGAEFAFAARLPVAAADPPSSPPLAGVDCVVAAPNPIVRRALGAQLEALGARAETCGRLGDLATALEDGPDRVFLIDDAWAGVDAIDVDPARAALVLVAPDQRDRLADRLEAGFAGWIVKPWRRASLIERVRAAWNGERADAPAVDARRAEPVVPERAGADGPRVLLVEDNPVNRLLAEAQLKRLGAQVEVAVDGRAGLAAAEAGGFDLIVMDMRLPGIDGIEATRRLRGGLSQGADTPVIALTANASPDDRAACLSAGMNDFLTKPVAESALAEVIRRWTAKSAA